MKRCFVGLRINDDARSRLEAVGDELRALPESAALRLRPVKALSLHLTLKFLGPTPDEQVPEIIAALGEIASGAGELAGEIRSLSAFPSPARPRSSRGSRRRWTRPGV